MTENKKKAQEFHDLILNEGLYERSEDLVHENIIFSLNQNNALIGINAFKNHMSPIQQAFPDLTYTTNSLIEENNTVILHWEATGTHTTKLGEIPATGKKVELKGLSLFEFKDGRIKENLVYFNEMEIPKQLGVL